MLHKTLSDSSSNHLACALALNFRDAFLNIVHEPISTIPSALNIEHVISMPCPASACDMTTKLTVTVELRKELLYCMNRLERRVRPAVSTTNCDDETRPAALLDAVGVLALVLDEVIDVPKDGDDKEA